MRADRKLSLSRETVRLLAEPDLAKAAAGGAITGIPCPAVTGEPCQMLSLGYVNTGCCPGPSGPAIC